MRDEDIRLSPSGKVVAAPYWAYEYWCQPRSWHGCYHPIEELWGPWHARRRAEREEEAARLKEEREHYALVSADPEATELQRNTARMWLSFRRGGREAHPDRPAPSLAYPDVQAIKRCRHCGDKFFGLGNASTCTPACHATRRKATRTRGEPRSRLVTHEPRRCDHCWEAFTPRREDARFCSVRCRVAHHRTTRTIGTTTGGDDEQPEG